MNQLNANRLKMWLVVLGVFVLGCVTGASLGGVYRSRAAGEGRPGEYGKRKERGEHFERIRRELGLNDDQSAKVRIILDETRQEFRQLRYEARPRYDAIRLNSQARIRAVLTPEQQKIFDDKIAEQDARAKERDEHSR